ncbi:transcriptional regulator [Tistrella bauzanensis]|uniref:Transcriptional regulator n=1 Tax=Tistrella bauzanensis TaxID=657419 RepID=A0ABQ1IG59_9PROT|nr:LysR family transcriptional regulator [Tistrella bauzanensis]GGB37929.1 transcriptional regulator [Tistrella bauzanensis]
MTPTIDPELLRCFRSVARLGRFKAAADHLGRSPASVSMQVRRLEDLVGARLLDRDNRHVALTPAGDALLADAEALLALNDRILRRLDRGSGQGPLIRLGLPDEYAARIIGDALAMVTADHPGIELTVETAPSGRLAEIFAAGRLDMAVMVAPLVAGDGANARIDPVWAGARHLPPTPPDDAAQAGRDATPLPLALYDAGCPYRQAAAQALAAMGRPWRPVLISPSNAAVDACIEAGLAVGVIDRRRLTPSLREIGADWRLPPLPAHGLHLHRASRARGAAFDALEAGMRHAFAGMGRI